MTFNAEVHGKPIEFEAQSLEDAVQWLVMQMGVHGRLTQADFDEAIGMVSGEDQQTMRELIEEASQQALKRANVAASEYSPATDVDFTELPRELSVIVEESNPLVWDRDKMVATVAAASESKNAAGLYPHQQAIMDELREHAAASKVPVILASEANMRAGLMRERTRLDGLYGSGGGIRGDNMLVIDYKLHRREDDPDAAEPIQVEQPKKRSVSPSLMIASMVAMVTGTAPHLNLLDDPFAALDRRVLSPEEAREAFKTSDADKARMAAAEAKRARKAAKLKRG